MGLSIRSAFLDLPPHPSPKPLGPPKGGGGGGGQGNLIEGQPYQSFLRRRGVYFCRRETEEKEKESARFSSFPSSPARFLFSLILGYPAGASAAERDITENKGTPYSPRVSFEAGRRTQRPAV